MAKAKGLYAKVAHEPIFHKTSIGVRLLMKNTEDLDKLAILWNKTKDEKYKILWYKKLREAWAYGRFGTLDDDIPVERRGVDKDTSRIY
jgi:hypothetical protein